MQSSTDPIISSSNLVIRSSLPTDQMSTDDLKIAIIGAGGKIGKRVVEYIWLKPKKFLDLDTIVTINTNPKKLQGLAYDFYAAHSEKLFSKKRIFPLNHILTDDYSQIANANYIFITAGNWADEKQRAEFAAKDDTGRLIQSMVNYPLIKQICADIRKYAPKSTVIVVTNQVDMMTSLARQELPGQTVLGLGGVIDTMRYKTELAKLLHKAGYISSNDPARISAHIIGFHNNSMMLLRDSLKIDKKEPDFNDPAFCAILDQAIENTRKYGKMVSDLQKDPKQPGIDTGSSITPAKAITNCIADICLPEAYCQPYNIILKETAAKKYGVEVNTALSIPVYFFDHKILPDILYFVSDSEKDLLRKAQQSLEADIKLLFALQANQPQYQLSTFYLPHTSEAPNVTNYATTFIPCFTQAGDLRLAIRSFEYNAVSCYMTVDPYSFATECAPVTNYFHRRLVADVPSYYSSQEINSTPYRLALSESTKETTVIQNAGLQHAKFPVDGVIMTVDMCPSVKPYEADFFVKLAAYAEVQQGPVPVAISMTGAWLLGHDKEFKQLITLEQTNKIKITWVNHSFSHIYYVDLNGEEDLKRNLMLSQPTNIKHELLEVERLLIKNGQVPSVFFRAPGLVTDGDGPLINKLNKFGLILVGSDAWLAKGEQPTNGSIILVHGNSNESAGIKKANELLEQKRFRFFPLAEAVRPPVQSASVKMTKS